MFNSNLQNSVLNDIPNYILQGSSEALEVSNITSREALGGIHPSSLRTVLHSLVQTEDTRCLNTVMDYWAERVSKRQTLNSADQKLRKLLLIQKSTGESSVLLERSIRENAD